MIYHRQTNVLSQNELRSKPITQQKNILTLSPSGTFDLEFGVVVDWPPGNYKIDIRVEASGKETNSWDFVVGKVKTIPQSLLVAGEIKPEDEGITQ